MPSRGRRTARQNYVRNPAMYSTYNIPAHHPVWRDINFTPEWLYNTILGEEVAQPRQVLWGLPP